MRTALCYLLIPVALLMAGTLCAQSRADLWSRDLEFFERELPRRHANFFAHVEPATFRSEMQRLRQDLEQLEEYERVIRLQEIIRLAGDSHTSTGQQAVHDSPVLPMINLRHFSDGLYILTTVQPYEQILGKRITAINDIPLAEVEKRLARFEVIENEGMRKKVIPYLLNRVWLLQHYDIMEKNAAGATLSLEDTLGQTSEVTLSVFPNMTALEQERVLDLRSQTIALPFALLDTRIYFRQQYFPEEQTHFVQYNRCWSREMERRRDKKNAKNLLSFDEFSKTLIKTLDEKPVRKLIIDLRYNSGGSSLQGRQLAERLAARPDLPEKTNVFVLLGRRTYSSAILNALDFRNLLDATFIGEATSGRPNHFGELKRLSLPNTGLSILYSTKYFQQVPGDPPALEPEVRTESSFSDFLEGIDPAWEYVRKL